MSIARQTPKDCEACGKPLPIIRKLSRRFCNKSCAWAKTKGPAYNARIGREYAEKNGDTQRGRGQGKAYRKRMGRHEHRRIAEEAYGRLLERTEIVHHKDGNHLNNDPANLEVVTQADHMRRHGLAVPGVTMAWKPWTYTKKWRRRHGCDI